MTASLQHTIEVACPVERLYGYVTQPWHWHEWHPSSVSATQPAQALQAGDEFDEVIRLQPLSPLPLTLQRQVRHRVVTVQPLELWEDHGRMRDGWFHLRYEFVRAGEVTRFTRTLTYGAAGLSRVLMPLLKRRQEAISLLALGNLKRRMEAGGTELVR